VERENTLNFSRSTIAERQNPLNLSRYTIAQALFGPPCTFFGNGNGPKGALATFHEVANPPYSPSPT